MGSRCPVRDTGASFHARLMAPTRVAQSGCRWGHMRCYRDYRWWFVSLSDPRCVAVAHSQLRCVRHCFATSSALLRCVLHLLFLRMSSLMSHARSNQSLEPTAGVCEAHI